MPTISQAQINRIAFKQGVKPEEITRRLSTFDDWNIDPNTGLPSTKQNLLITKSGTSTGVAQTIQPNQVTAPAWATYWEANILPPSVTGFSTPKPTIATTDKPVIGTPPATTPKAVDFTTMTPEQLKAQYMTIGTKLPWEVTDEDRRFAKYLQTRIGLGETMDKIFGGTWASSGKTTYSTELVQPWENIASSVRNSDGSYQVTYKDWTSQRTTSEPSTTVFPEWTPEYFAQKKAQENQKQLDVLTQQMNTEAERRKKETADLVAKYGENIATQFQTQKAEIEANGAKRMDALNTGLSFSGFGRSTLALEKRDEIAKNIETTINQAKAKADLELMAYRMEQEWADQVAISGMRKNIADVQANIDQANYENQLEIIKLNQENATSGAEAMNNLLETISNSAEIVSNADLKKSQELGYFVDKNGAIMLDSQKRPIQFEGTPWSLDPSAISSYADALKKGIIDEKWLDKLSPNDKAAVLKHVSVQDGSWVGTGFVPWTSGMRTDRHNNPVAMTTDVAKTLGLVEWVDYTVGDSFNTGKWRVLYTARLNGDGVQTTIKALDTAAKDPNKKAFYTQWGGQRWTYIGMSDEEWLSKTPEEKAQVIATMYKNEWGNGSINAGTFVVWGSGGGAGVSDLAQSVQKGIITIAQIPAAQRAKVAEELARAGQSSPKSIELQNSLNLVDTMLQDEEALKSISWWFGWRIPWTGIFADQLAVNQYNQLKWVLSLWEREKLKGTGAISDFESKMLAESSSALGRNLSEEDFKKELEKIRDILSWRYKYFTTDVNTTPNTGGQTGGTAQTGQSTTPSTTTASDWDF